MQQLIEVSVLTGYILHRQNQLVRMPNVANGHSRFIFQNMPKFIFGISSYV